MNIIFGVAAVIIAATTEGSEIADWIVYLIAADLLLSAIVEIIEVIMIRSYGFKTASVPMSAVVSLLVSILMFCFPAFINRTFFTVAAILILAAGIISAAAGVQTIRREKAEKLTEADWVDKNQN